MALLKYNPFLVRRADPSALPAVCSRAFSKCSRDTVIISSLSFDDEMTSVSNGFWIVNDR